MAPQVDLALLTADGNAHEGIKAILGRTQALAIREIAFSSLVHPEHDPGCLGRSHDLLRPYVNLARYALVVFDREGSGDDRPAPELEAEVEQHLQANGWAERSAAIVIEPEFDAWVWSPSPHVDTILGWKDRSPGLRSWLMQQGFLEAEAGKPARPKEAMEHALREVKKPRSSARYREIGKLVSLTNCTDRAFVKLRTTLQTWFASS